MSSVTFEVKRAADPVVEASESITVYVAKS
jgi:hypothetical protein